MKTLARQILLALGLALPAPALLADPALRTTAPGIELVEVGIFCQVATVATATAPETELGYVTLLPGTPQIAFRQQEVPARLGVQFGVVVRSDRIIERVRNETWAPGVNQPDIWYQSLAVDDGKARGFMFEFPEELRIGTWRMDAFDGDTLLYSVAWEVLPADALPGVGSDCGLVS